MHDLLIIGAGPAGLCAAIYGKRAGLSTMVLEKEPISGGQIVNTYEVDNYPGLAGISGYDLGEKFREHAEAMGTEFAETEVECIVIEGNIKKVKTKQGTYEGKTLIVATGATNAKLRIPGEEEFLGMGVSYCATCDGAFFKNRTSLVIGGGDVAVEDAIFLARNCKKVYLLHRRHELRAAKIAADTLSALTNVEIIWDSIADEIKGTNQVENVRIHNVETGQERTIATDGVFIAVGILPQTSYLKGVVKLDKYGYVEAGEDTLTSVPGVFAAGDIRSKQLRQVVTAIADGANAVTSVQNYLLHVTI